MNTTTQSNNNHSKPPAEGRSAVAEHYAAPPPPSKGRIIGLDLHPDVHTAAVFTGTTPHDARKLAVHDRMSLARLLKWAAAEFTREDLFVMEAGSNSFEIHRQLHQLGLRAIVLESAHVGSRAKTYADDDRMAAARIVKVFLAGDAPCVWVPDEATRTRRELLHAYQSAVQAHVAATNALKGWLNQATLRLGKRNPALPKTRQWLLAQRDWAPLQKLLLENHFVQIDQTAAQRKTLLRLIAAEISTQPLMLRCMKLLGIGTVNAFAILAVIGDVRRFQRPEKLVAYLGLNPGQRRSGEGKHIRLGVGKRGRGDLRHLLIQGAQAVLRMGRRTELGQWGWRIFARKGSRNIAVAAVARKLAVQIWHLLHGNPPLRVENDKSLNGKLQKLAVTLGKKLRCQLGLPATLPEVVQHFQNLILQTPEKLSTS